MNVTLHATVDKPEEEPVRTGPWTSVPWAGNPTIQEQITSHADVMRHNGFLTTGNVALVTEDFNRYPGSYQVWLETSDASGLLKWVWVDSEGLVHEFEHPTQA